MEEDRSVKGAAVLPRRQAVPASPGGGGSWAVARRAGFVTVSFWYRRAAMHRVVIKL
ncbi:hypothetical protein SPHINGOT1_40077 [Sphingomonas sp. T1]|nr:hypothetical protein SPHINGOT1_40077 [Sphingomonas sp. T1]